MHYVPTLSPSLSMADVISPNPIHIYNLPAPPPSALAVFHDHLDRSTRSDRLLPIRCRPLRFTSEFDSEGPFFLHKLSCKFFNNLAKFKFSLQNNIKGEFFRPHLGFVTKNLSVLYDVESHNSHLRGSLQLGKNLNVRSTYNLQYAQIWIPECFGLSWTTNYFFVTFTCNDKKSILTCISFGSVFRFKYQRDKERSGEVEFITSLADRSIKLELSVPVTSVGLPRAALQFPYGEIALQPRENFKENDKVLSVDGILKCPMWNGVSTLVYNRENLNLRYLYKDAELTFIPSVDLLSNKASFAFKRRLSLSDKLSYWYHFDSSAWSAVYKHTIGKDLKMKAGYDSMIRLGWASLWVNTILSMRGTQMILDSNLLIFHHDITLRSGRHRVQILMHAAFATCCILYNFLGEMRLDIDTRLLDEVDAELMTDHLVEDLFDYDEDVNPIQATNSRDNLASTIFTNISLVEYICNLLMMFNVVI